MYDPCFGLRRTIIVFDKLPRHVLVPVPDVGREVLHAPLHVVPAVQEVEQAWVLPPQHRQVVLVPQGDLHLVLGEQVSYLENERTISKT